MAGKRGGVPKPTLCWECAKSDRGACSWSSDYEPVPGWVATFDARLESYHVDACPEFVHDATNWEPDELPDEAVRDLCVAIVGSVLDDYESALQSHEELRRRYHRYKARSEWRKARAVLKEMRTSIKLAALLEAPAYLKSEDAVAFGVGDGGRLFIKESKKRFYRAQAWRDVKVIMKTWAKSSRIRALIRDEDLDSDVKIREAIEGDMKDAKSMEKRLAYRWVGESLLRISVEDRKDLLVRMNNDKAVRRYRKD